MIEHAVFTDIEHGIAMSLRAAYLSMHRLSDASIMKYGVTGNQFIILKLLTQEDGIIQQELCRRACSDPNTIRAMLVLLEKRGFVKRTQCKKDGRKRIVTITDKGRNIFGTLWEETKTIRNRFLSALSVEEIEVLISQLKRISEVMK